MNSFIEAVNEITGSMEEISIYVNDWIKPNNYKWLLPADWLLLKKENLMKTDITWINPKIVLPNVDTLLCFYTIQGNFYIGKIKEENMWVSNDKEIPVKNIKYWSYFYLVIEDDAVVGFIGIKDSNLTILGYLPNYEDDIEKFLQDWLQRNDNLYISYDDDDLWGFIQKLGFDLVKDTYQNKTCFRITLE